MKSGDLRLSEFEGFEGAQYCQSTKHFQIVFWGVVKFENFHSVMAFMIFNFSRFQSLLIFFHLRILDLNNMETIKKHVNPVLPLGHTDPCESYIALGT